MNKLTLQQIDDIAYSDRFYVCDPLLEKLINEHGVAISARLWYYVFLYTLVGAMQPSVALELGVEYGVASAHMCAACVDGIVIGIDKNYHHTPGRDMLYMFGERYKYLLGDTTQESTVAQVQQLAGPDGIGLVFQDSSHHYDESCMEWDLYRPMMLSGGLWVCDDIHQSFRTPEEPKGMVEYFQERPGQKRLYLYPCGGNNVGVIICD